MVRLLRLAAPLSVVVLTLTACAGSGSTGDTADGTVSVVAAFYPLQYAVQQVGGDRVAVTTLTKAGAEPHDLELTPRDVTSLGKADLVVYERRFQPAVDDAIDTVTTDTAFDVSSSADLTLAAAGDGHGAEDTPSEEGVAPDPHFWLDPVRYAAVATAIGARLAQTDPDHATEYAARSKDLVARLGALDEEFRTVLTGCTSTDLVTGHASFAYLADRYGLNQEGIAGVNPDLEPSARQLREIAAHVRGRGLRTVYAETLVSPALTETLAREGGAKVALLDPLEGITDQSAGADYFEVMRSNLATLSVGQGCP